MKLSIICCCLLLLNDTASIVATENRCSISGIVRDLTGKPLAGAVVSLSQESKGQDPRNVLTGDGGDYRFDALPNGEFQISVTLKGYDSSSSKHVTTSDAAPVAQLDFTLESTLTETPIRPGPKFEAAGIRGLIDPGGYSAPATAAASSGLIKSMADLKRAENRPDMIAKKVPPCSEESSLRTAEQSNPNSFTAKRQLGNFYAAHGSLAKGIKLLEQAHRMSASDVEIVEDLAAAYLAAGNFIGARNLLLPLPEKSADAHRLLARADEGAGLFREASAEYSSAAQQDPSEENRLE